MYYRIEYYNKMWKDWLYFDQEFYKTEEAARKVIDSYKEQISGFKTRITETKILDEKPRQTSKRNLGTKVSVEKA